MNAEQDAVTIHDDEEFAKADAEYAAVPGTPPSYRDWRTIDHARPVIDQLKEMCGVLRKAGATHLRATIHGTCLWVDGWDRRPYKEEPFSPIRVTTPNGDV